MASAKLERLLNLVAELLETDRPLPAQEIRTRLETYPEDDESFKRAFERDKDSLRDMNIPLEMGPDPRSDELGYYIDRDKYALADPDLDPDELAALHLAAAAIRLDGTDVTSGMRKLGGGAASGALPSQMALLPSAPQLGTLLEGVSLQQRLEFRHRGKLRTVDPFQLLVDHGHWYLRAYDVAAKGVRSYRVDRIEGDVTARGNGSATNHVDPSEHPVELAEWALGDGDPVAVTVRVVAEKAALAQRLVGTGGIVTTNEDASVDIELPVRRMEGLRGFVLSFLGDAEVVAPAEVNDEIVAWLEAIAAGRSSR